MIERPYEHLRTLVRHMSVTMGTQTPHVVGFRMVVDLGPEVTLAEVLRLLTELREMENVLRRALIAPVDVASPIRVHRLSYSNPFEIVLIGGSAAFLLALLRTIRDWKADRDIRRSYADMAQAFAEAYRRELETEGLPEDVADRVWPVHDGRGSAIYRFQRRRVESLDAVANEDLADDS